MTALGVLYEEVEGKSLSQIVRVGGVQGTPGPPGPNFFDPLVTTGQTMVVRSIDIQYTMGVAGAASFEIANPVPAFITEETPVEIFLGYNGIYQIVFVGAVVSPSPTATGAVIECAGEGRKLTRTFKRTVITISGTDVNAVVISLLEQAGVTNFAVNLPAWSVGAIVPGVIEFTTYGDAINQLAMVDGDPWYETPSGQIRVEVKDPWPSSSAFRQYFSGDLVKLTDAERLQLAEGTLPISATQPPGITNPNAHPRIRTGIKQVTMLQNVRNLVVVEGAAVDVTDPVTGNSTSGRLEATSTAASPWVPPQPSGPGKRDITYDMVLVDTQAKLDLVAARYEYKNNRLDQHVSLQVDGDPELVLGMTLQVEDPQYTGISGNWFLYGYNLRANRQDFLSELDLRGGILSGTTPLIAPVADFIFANPKLSVAKVGQVLPAGAGNIVIYDGRASFDPDGKIVNYEWSDDQGNFQTGLFPVVSFSYDEAITSVQMTLTVTDNDGLTDAVTKTVPLNAVNDCGSSDTTTAMLAAAIKTHASISDTGGKAWTDVSKAAAGVSGDFTTARLCIQQGPGAPSSGNAALFGTTAGEFIRTQDNLATNVKYSLPSGSAIVGIQPLSPIMYLAQSDFVEYWFIATAAAEVYIFIHRNDNGDYFLGLLGRFNSAGAITGIARLENPFIYGGDTSDPASLLQDVYGSFVDFSHGGTFSGSGTFKPNPWPPFTGDILAAINAAGPGHHIVAAATFPAVTFPLDCAAIAIMFDAGVSPQIWWVDSSTNPAAAVWQPATGVAGGLTGVALAAGFDKDSFVAVFNQLKAYFTTTDTAYTQGAGNAPSQIAHLIEEWGLLGVYLGAASGGLVKSLDQGDTWGYIRPNVSVGTTWPAGADGKQVDMWPGTTALPTPCPHIYSLARVTGGGSGRQLVRLSTGVWSVVEASRDAQSFGLRYFGAGHFLAMVNGGLPQISSDYGTTWAAGGFPAGGAHTYNHLHDCQIDAAGTRLWGLWHASSLGDQNAIAYSNDFGATWHLSQEDTTSNSFLTGIACHPSNKDRVAVVGQFTFTTGVWICGNASATVPTWTKHLGSGLPGADTGIIYPPTSGGFQSPQIIWTPYSRLIISSGGQFLHSTGDLYYSDDLGLTWTASTYGGVSPQPNQNNGMQLFRILTFGPFFMLYGTNGAAGSALLRSDDYGISWKEVTTPNTSDGWLGLSYDPITDTLLLMTSSHLWGLTPASSDPLTTDWKNMTANLFSVAAGQFIYQPLGYVYDVPQNVTP